MERKFNLGRMVITSGAARVLETPFSEGYMLLNRHSVGDWGELDDQDKRMNENGLIKDSEGNYGRLMSVYTSKSGVKLWVITEWDRSCTTILLPEEY